MAFRIEKRTRAALIGLPLLAAAAFAQEALRYEVWHGHSRPPHIKKAGNTGTLTITGAGVSFEETYKDGKTPKRPHSSQWKYDDIQQLTVSPKQLKVLTYKDCPQCLRAKQRGVQCSWATLRRAGSIGRDPEIVLCLVPSKS